MKPRTTRAPPAFVCGWEAGDTRYPVYVDAAPGGTGPRVAVVLTDGDYFFDPAVQAARALAARGLIPAPLVVGVGYGAGFGEAGNRRGRDYTPTRSADEPSSGGADAFLGFLRGTLWPELARLFPVREDVRAIAGHSLGSLLVLRALFHEEPFFNRALASAPSVWWDDRAILGQIAALRGRTSRLEGALYLGVGAEDTPSMRGDLELLEAQLRARPFEGLRVAAETFPSRDHFDVVPLTLEAGLAYLLG